MNNKKLRYRIAFFTTYLEADEYNQQLWKSIEDECIKRNIDLMMFSSRNMKDKKKHQLIYDEICTFFNPDLFDGIILSSSSLINHLGKDFFYEKIDSLRDKKIVNINIDIDGLSCIRVDNEYGMSQMAKHLVEVHHFKKILYISASDDYPESVIRLNSFRNKLAEYEIYLDDQNILHGDFTTDSVIPILTPLLQRSALDYDVIVCANDTMASKCIDLLKEYGYSVPRDITVTGFDNSTSAKIQLPKITTIAQPLEKMGSEAVKLILEQIEDDTPSRNILIKPDLILNESCGCFLHDRDQTLSFKESKFKDILDFETIVNSEEFIEKVERFVYANCKEFSISDLEEYIFSYLKSSSIKDEKLLWEIIQKLVPLFNDINSRALLYEHIIYRDNIVERRLKTEKLLTSEDLPNLFTNIDSLFGKNNISSYYIYLYEHFDNDNALCLEHGKREEVLINPDSESDTSLVNKFIPASLLPTNRSTLISLPLFAMNRFFGFLLIESNNYNINFYENIQTNISSALMNILYLQQIKETQKLQIESKKIEFLGNMIAGLAHEINTPVGILLTSTSYLKDDINHLNECFIKEQLSKNRLETFFQEAQETFSLVDNNLNKTISLIQRFKMIVKNYDISGKSYFDLRKLLDNLLEKLGDELNRKHVNVIIDSNREFPIKSYSIIFEQLFLELLNNSLSHGYTENQGGEIHIELSRQHDNILIIYDDDGKNCSQSQISDIFNPFFTTKRYEGYSGLGLTILYNLVRINLSGTMECKLGKNSKGLSFKITFPEKKES